MRRHPNFKAALTAHQAGCPELAAMTIGRFDTPPAVFRAWYRFARKENIKQGIPVFNNVLA